MRKIPAAWLCWLALAMAIFLEVLGTTIMKLSHAWLFAHAILVGLVGMWICIALSYYCLAIATLRLPVGVAFACWEAAGLSLITLSATLIVGETLSLQRCLGLICVLSGALLVHAGTSSSNKSSSPNSGQ